MISKLRAEQQSSNGLHPYISESVTVTELSFLKSADVKSEPRCHLAKHGKFLLCR